MNQAKQATMASNPKTIRDACVAGSAAVSLTAAEPFSCFYGKEFW